MRISDWSSDVCSSDLALEEISWKQALVVGFAQCLAMVPGTSRSGATIISGMMAGIQRKTATEFSFFLAMPTMLAATVYDLYSNRSEERRVGKACGSTCKYLWSRYH